MQDQHNKSSERTPLGQVIFDEIFLLFLASLVISFVLYNVWGLLELLNVPFLK